MGPERKYLIDTNIISELGRTAPDRRVLDWLESYNPNATLSVITVKELYYGALRLPDGRRRESLLALAENLVWLYDEDVLPFDAECALIYAQLHDRAVRAGRTPQIEDLMIASIALKHRLTVVTRNVKDLAYLDVPVLNPFEE